MVASMDDAPITFHTSRTRLQRTWLFVAVSFALTAGAIYLAFVQTMGLEPFAVMSAVTLGYIPGILFLGAMWHLLCLLDVVTVTNEKIRVSGPFGRREMSWDEALCNDVPRPTAERMRLQRRNGTGMSLQLASLDNSAELLRYINDHVSEPAVNGPLCARYSVRYVMPTITVGLFFFLGWMISLAGGRSIPDLLSFFAVLAVLYVPGSLHALTQGTTLQDGVLTRGSCFGRKRIVLDASVKAVATRATTSRSESIALLATDGTKIVMRGNLPYYSLFRSAIVARVGQPAVEDRRASTTPHGSVTA